MSNIIITPSKNNVFGLPIEIGFHDNVNDNYDENKDLPYPIAPPFGYKNTIYIKLNNNKIKKYIMNNNDLSERTFNLGVSDVNDNSPITLTYNNNFFNPISDYDEGFIYPDPGGIFEMRYTANDIEIIAN